MKGILGRKIGMTQVFSTNGTLVPVTVIAVEPNVVTQIKTKDNDGYDAIQLATVTTKEQLDKLKDRNTIYKVILSLSIFSSSYFDLSVNSDCFN